MLVTQNRPRVLRWFHAGPLLFGDWGTSRLYVLGLAFYYTGHASPLFLAAISLLMVCVAWAYTVVCRCFPEGGGVYTAAREVSPTLAVVGATLLLCDYIVTAALSAVEGFHYLGLERGWVVWASIAAIFAIGVVNWLGARSAGRLALVIAVIAIAMSFIVGLLCLPMAVEGLSTISTGHPSISDAWSRWESFVRIVLALAGVEAVANMTGLMTKPVARTAKRTIWPVLIEVVTLNMIFGIALNALPAVVPVEQPHYVQFERTQGLASDQVPEQVKQYRDTAVKVLAQESGTRAMGESAGRALGVAAGIIFGLLLLSAVNTALMAMVSVKFTMTQDHELPGVFAKLNYSGVPWIGLVVACVAPAIVLAIVSDVKALGELYAIGVVGAITINFLCCASNRRLQIRPWERRGLWTLGVFMAMVELTIIIAKPNATIFAGSLITVVLGTRWALHAAERRRATLPPVPVPATGWLAELERPAPQIDPSKPKIMLAARGRAQAEFAVDLARRRGATLLAIYVRTLRVIDLAPGSVPQIKDDPAAAESLGSVAVLARQAGVPFIPIYVSSPDIAEEILDYTVTFGCDTLIMGKSRRLALSRSLEGDVVAQVARNLPPDTALVLRDAIYEPRAGRSDDDVSA
jgi:amino acid transporter/nucleotide-binding universal stress UspA family protein